MKKRPKRIQFDGFTRWTNKWLGSFSCGWTPSEAARGQYSKDYRHWKRVMFPFVASMHKVGGERIRVRINFIY